MTSTEIAAWLQALAGAGTLVAAGFAAWFTRTAPARAAELAERLRVQNERITARRTEQSLILRALMVHRGSVMGPEAAQAINAIPTVFSDDLEVMEAYRALCQDVGIYTHRKLDLYLAVIVSVSKSLGLAAGLNRSDLILGYFITPPAEAAAQSSGSAAAAPASRRK